MFERQSLWVALMVGALTLLGGCGDETPSVTNTENSQDAIRGPGVSRSTDRTRPVTVEAPSDVASLVPADSDMLLYVPSVEDLEGKLRRVVSAIDPQMVDQVDVNGMLSQMAGPLLDLVDRSKPLAIAMKMDPEAGPVPTMVLPVTDVAAAKKRFKDGGQQEPASSGSYVQMMMKPGAPPAGGSTLATDIPEGDLVVRVNLAQLVAENREQVDAMLEEM
jgi:hypothetical protein